MSGVTTNEPRSRPRRRWGRYSLRTLFLLTTAAALGMGWWRAPFTVEVVHECDLVKFFDQLENPEARELDSVTTRQAVIREVATMRRVWGGDPVRDGPRRFFEGELLLAEETYADGVLHGPYTQWSLDGKVEVRGEFVQGERHGDWTLAKHTPASLRTTCPFSKALTQKDDEKGFSDLAEAVLGESTTRYERGRRIMDTTTVQGPERELEIEIREYDPDAELAPLWFKRRARWTHDRTRKLEQEEFGWDADGGKMTTTGWYRTGERRYHVVRRNTREATIIYWDRSGRIMHDLVFTFGLVVSDNGDRLEEFAKLPPLEDRYWESGEFVDGKLRETVGWSCEGRPLAEMAVELSAAHRMSIVIDLEAFAVAGLSPRIPLSIVGRALPLHSALAVAFAPHDLTAVALYDQLFITTEDRIPHDAERPADFPSGPPKRWHDPTHVEDFRRHISQVNSRGYLCLGKLETLPSQPTLRQVVETLRKEVALAVEVRRELFTDEAWDRRVVTLFPERQDTADVLGSALFQAGGKLTLENGKLVIVPREGLPRRASEAEATIKDPQQEARP